MKKLRVREWQARFAGLRNLRLFSVDVRESKQYYSRQIALDAGFLCHSLAEFNGKSECDSSPVFSPPLTLAIDLLFFFFTAKKTPFKDVLLHIARLPCSCFRGAPSEMKLPIER